MPAGRHHLGEIDRKRVALDDAQPLRAQFGECRKTATITLDRDNVRTDVEQRPRQSARARPDLENPSTIQVAGHVRDSVKQLRIEQKVLAKRLRCVKPVALDDVAKRWPMQERRLSQTARAAAASPATRIAAIIAPELAMLRPAIPKAVP